MAPLYTRAKPFWDRIFYFTNSAPQIAVLVTMSSLYAVFNDAHGFGLESKRSTEVYWELIDNRYGYENFSKLSSHTKGKILHDLCGEVLVSKNSGELHLP
eukprot:NODE_7510_length_432_cov_113.029508_g7344_i0.p1 GENE.NODE_7510_length_432_cov_113.029508_g7344_i0~~NODE_7510_length_432_cov_113.029508_g7344_i0.p1  ORF type:complete len:100 (+),score=9.09 NODE_7510_length_432_cov_113.029508_g7344_i0:68-367(+)